MSTWRGGFKPAFPSQSNHPTASSTLGSSASTPTSAFAGFNSAGPSTFPRGRGRGRGAARGLLSKRGGSNLSWKRSDTTPTTELLDAQEPETQDTDASEPSAFEAFGAVANPTIPSAFGAEGSAFGTASTMFGSSSTTPFPSSTTQRSTFAPASTSEFATTSKPTSFSAPLAERNDPEPVVVVASAKRNPAQISTLEVLGEDSDARRKRFESTLPNNRYLELKPLREEQRLEAIEQGLIPDPSKPMRLDQATDFEGTCDEMCPEWEREEREYQNNVDPLERYPGTTRIDPARAVKAFHRPAAGNDQPLPSDVRPPAILYQTLDYLFHTLLPQHPLAVTHPFVRDRTRSVRQDFTVQNVRGYSAIECNERIARYHILALGTLREQTGFSESQELEQLRKVLKSLNEFYDDLRISNPNVSLPNEAEFRSYHLLTHLRDPDIIWSTELLPAHVFSHPSLQTALELHRLAQRSKLTRGERASPNMFSRFFKLVESRRVSYLFGCILSTHFNEIRKHAIETLKGAYLKQHSAFPLRTLTKLLGCDDESDTRNVCEQLGVVVRQDERGKLVAELHKGTVLKAATLKLTVSQRLVEAKRGETSYQSVIDGTAYSTNTVETYPTTPWLASPSTFAPPVSQPRPPTTSSALSTALPNRDGSAFGSSSAFPNASQTEPPLQPAPSTRPPLAPVKPAPLDAAASPFVPSFGTNPSTASTGFSFAASAPTPSITPVPPPQSSSTTFSFAPTATPFVPAAAPITNASLPVPNFFSNNLSTPVTISAAVEEKPLSSTAPAFVPQQQQQQPHAQVHNRTPLPTVSTGHRRTSSSLRLSPQLVKSGASPKPPPPPPSPAVRPKPKIDHTALIDRLVTLLTREILQEFTIGPVRKASQQALKLRWNQLEQAEQFKKRKIADEMSNQLVDEIGRMLIKEQIVRFKRERGIRSQVLRVWNDKTVELEERRKEGELRKKEWERVVESLGQHGRRTMTVDEDETRSVDDDYENVEDEDDQGDLGLAGDGTVDFELCGLNLGVDHHKLNQRVLGKEENVIDMAEQLRLAAETRDRIWAHSTFFNILSSHLSIVAGRQRLPTPATWTTLVSTDSSHSSFATWLSCKFDLDEDDKRKRRSTAEANLVVQMLSTEEEPDQEDLDSTGLIILDCSSSNLADSDTWDEPRARLQSLVDEVDRNSLYKPALLVLVCARQDLDENDTKGMQDQVQKNLDLDSYSDKAHGFSILNVKLDSAEVAFKRETQNLLSSIKVHDQRIRRPLTAYSTTLLRAWRTSVHEVLNRCKQEATAPMIVSTYVAELQEIVNDIDSVVHPPVSFPASIPSFPDVKNSFRQAVGLFVSNDSFAAFGKFPEISTAFAQRPPVSDYDLARLLLELLDHCVAERYPATATTLQYSLDENLRSTLQKLEDSLGDIAITIREVDHQDALRRLQEQEPFKENKKRKASPPCDVSPNRSPKKASNVKSNSKTSNEAIPDRLSALERLMQETRALLTT
ncbi:Sac3p [Sporobolomyces koalae]|uniref:Sac3p n=1 Tax=Sporobolomyces koalae TaxID=500713 RepID=UPI0031715FBC